MSIGNDFKEIYKNFVANSENEKLIGVNCPPFAGRRIANRIKKEEVSDDAIVARLFAEINVPPGEKSAITAKELRYFTPDQLAALKNKVITEFKGNSDKLKMFEKVFGEAFVISKKHLHSEPKKRALLQAYESIKNMSSPVEKTAVAVPKTFN